jgi:hypothetical protein
VRALLTNCVRRTRPPRLKSRVAGWNPKVFDVNVRHGIAAAALLSTAFLTVACATPTTGTASAGGAVTSSVASTSSSAPSSPASSSPVASSPTAATTSPASDSSPATIEDSSVADQPTVTVVVEPVGLDATTAIWLQNSCTDINTLFGALFAIPTVDETASLEEFRAAYRDYYASLSDTLLEMTGRMAVLDPPTIDGGQALHDGYLNYLIGLADVSGSGAVAIDEAPDAETIADIVDQIEFETDQLGQADYGLADFQGAELQALMAQVPACQALLAT